MDLRIQGLRCVYKMTNHDGNRSLVEGSSDGVNHVANDSRRDSLPWWNARISARERKMRVYLHGNFRLNREHMAAMLKHSLERPSANAEEIAALFGYKAPLTARNRSWLNKTGVTTGSSAAAACSYVYPARRPNSRMVGIPARGSTYYLGLIFSVRPFPLSDNILRRL